MNDEARAQLFQQLRRVIAWEIDAQVGVHRPVDQMATFIADTLLDFFDIRLLPGADVSALD